MRKLPFAISLFALIGIASYFGYRYYFLSPEKILLKAAQQFSSLE